MFCKYQRFWCNQRHSEKHILIYLIKSILKEMHVCLLHQRDAKRQLDKHYKTHRHQQCIQKCFIETFLGTLSGSTSRWEGRQETKARKMFRIWQGKMRKHGQWWRGWSKSGGQKWERYEGDEGWRRHNNAKNNNK